MPKKVYRMRPTNHYNIGQYESWLYDMSLKGLHLKKLGIFLAIFEKGEPEKIRYRLDFNKSSGELGEQVSLYAQNGWMHITTFGEGSVYASPETTAIPELHTDPIEQADSLKRVEFHLRILAIGAILFVSFLTYTYIRSLLFVQPTLNNNWSEVILNLMFIGLWAGLIVDWYAIWSIRRRLLSGNTIDHHAPWKYAFYIRNTYNAVFLLTCLTVITTSWVDIF